ncbi:hypothetical protein ACET3X_002010 [Alternaria dauci]|uniref:Uncharacterized protein n=1 Tax=Alternaria dauci TaxID=48095 RepID=A0ABR3UYZ9_9PLEO
MFFSRVPNTASIASSDSDMSIIDDFDEPEDFVVISPDYHPDHDVAGHSARSSSSEPSDRTAMAEYSQAKQNLLEQVSKTLFSHENSSVNRPQGRKHVAAIETCRHHLRFSHCDMACNGPTKCDGCVSLIAGLETLANCAREWSCDSRPFRENISRILHRLYGLPFRFQPGLYGVIDALVKDWPTADQENFEAWGFKVSAVLWLLCIGVQGLTRGLQEGKEWRLLLIDAECAWYQKQVVAEEYEEAVEDIQRFADVLRKWGTDVVVQQRTQSSATPDVL